MISYIRMFVLLGGIMTVVFGLLTTFIPGLCLAWAVYDSWNPGLGWQIEYMSMQPQIYVLTPWRLVSSMGGVFGIISILKDDVRFLRLGFLGIFLGIIGFLFLAPFRDGYMEDITIALPLPAYSLTFLGVAIMLSSLIHKFGGWYHLTLFSVPFIGLPLLLYPITAPFDGLPIYVSITNHLVPASRWLALLFILGFVLAFLGCFLCLTKTFASSSAKHNVDQVESQTD